MDNQTKNYRKSQFDKIKWNEFGINVKFYDDKGNTNSILLTQGEFNKIKELLTGIKQVTEQSQNQGRD